MRKSRGTVPAIAAAALLAAAPVAAVAQTAGAGGSRVVAEEPGQYAEAAAVEAVGIVEAIDKATREVAIRLPAGDLAVVVAGPEVRNFDNIGVGDRVIARYVAAIALQLEKNTGSTVRSRVERDAAARAKPGEKPGVAAGREVEVVANVVAVDRKQKTVTLRGVKRTVVLSVRNPEQLKLIKVGDQVQATFLEAVALSVEPVK